MCPNRSVTRKEHPTRLLAALELLQTHGRLSGAEMAAKLGVDRRSVRRYITALEDMGVPLAAERGPHGGYELVAGYKLPPLMFSDDEAVAVGLGLAAVRGFGLVGSGHAVESAAAKLARVMPARLQGRMRAITASVSFARARQAGDAAAPALAVVAGGVHSRHAVRFTYRASSGPTEREVDPYGLAFVRGHWYVVGFCHLRRAVRTFRLDRAGPVQPLTRVFERPAGFDALAHLRASIATLPRAYSVDVLVKTDLASAHERLVPEFGVLEAEGRHVRLRSEVDDLAWFARELAHLPWTVEVRSPRALRDALARHARALLRQAARRPKPLTHRRLLVA